MEPVLTKPLECKDVPGPNDEIKNRYFCINESHALCEKHSAKCPCGSSVLKRPSTVVGNLLQDLPWICKNYKNDCREIKADVKELSYHQGKCIFRQVFCPHYFCGRKILYKDVIDHMIIAHKNNLECLNIIEEKAGKLIVNDYRLCMNDFDFERDFSWKPTKISCGGDFFFAVTYFVNNIFHFWIYFLGSPDEARNFSSVYSFKNMIGETFNYGGPVHTLDESISDIIAAGSFFTVPKNAIKRSMDKEKMESMVVCITIRNLKEEAKDDDSESGISNDE